MKSFFVALTLALAPAAAFAGDGGFDVSSCVSASGRTMLSVFSDNYSGSTKPLTVRLTIDGQMVEYSNSAWDDPAVQRNYDTGEVTAQQNGQVVLRALKVRGRGGVRYVIKAGFKDPRAGTDFSYYGDNTKDISVDCREFYQGP